MTQLLEHQMKELKILVPPDEEGLPYTHAVQKLLRDAMVSHMEFRHVNDMEFPYGLDENYATQFASNVKVKEVDDFKEKQMNTYYNFIGDLMTELKTHDTEKEAHNMMPLVEKYAERWDRENYVPVLHRTLRVVPNGCKYEIVIDRKYDTSG